MDGEAAVGRPAASPDADRRLYRWEESEAAFRDCLAIYRDLGEQREVARTQVRYAHVFRDQHLNGQALPLIVEGLEAAQKLGERRAEASALVGRLDDAADDLARALAAFTKIGDRRWAARTRVSLGGLCRLRREWADARRR